jgi:hypothetical protein
LSHYKPIVLNGLTDRIRSTYSEWLIEKLNEEAITRLKNEQNRLPLSSGTRKMAVVSLGDASYGAFRKAMDASCGAFDFFHRKGTEEEYPTELFEQLKAYDVVLWAIHSDKVPDYPEFQSLADKRETHFCFFISPYRISKYAAVFPSAQSLMLAYENTEHAQQAAAQILSGRLPAKGKLPVTIAGCFEYGTGE